MSTTEDLIKQLTDSQTERNEINRMVFTLVGNLTHWRKGVTKEKREKILVGRGKIFALLARAKV